ncbi:21S rRNA (-2'-O)-methyltransferase [Blastomyces parvus]|uniref:rRNA methyltransferase 2, mitochondrial n=1 Tax=Blastomyces parvus TaxID=2060905 RepID=A0A2B7WG99_9EURO|nr:21S rRNA (-2'-O)-methyltransferase [Blastomyces parvus]
MTREISNLKHEIEHLKSQNSSHQALVSEKLSLERQLRSLEVELQSEKNALEKARLKGLEQSEVDSKISSELGELNKELARERREREKIENDMKTEQLEWARHRSVLESKLATLRNKLRQSKDNSDLDHPTILDDDGQEGRTRKRSTSRFETEITIATPGAAAAPRRISKVPTAPGEKSTFSTTPFLNRTSTTAESSGESETDSDAENVRRQTKRVKEDAEHSRPRPRKPAGSKATKPTKQRRPAKSQESVMVNSDDDQEVMQPTKPQNESSTSTTNKNAGIKRRLLPKKTEGTLFDDDDGFGDPNKDRRRVPSGFRALGGGQFGLGAPSRRLGGGRGLEAKYHFLILNALCTSLGKVRSTDLSCLLYSPMHSIQKSNGCLFVLWESQVAIEISKRYSSSSKRWQARQAKDKYSREAAVKGLKSRAAFKLLQINEKHKIFKPGQSVVDLGYAPGSWSQVAVDLTQPNGRVVGVDIIPAQPPKGVSTIQGNFLSPQIQAYVQEFLRNPNRGRALPRNRFDNADPRSQPQADCEAEETEGYIDRERSASSHIAQVDGDKEDIPDTDVGDRTVDVVLSDMSAPWDQTTGFWKKSLSDPYHRMMNTSGMNFRDHAGSMDLCRAALEFSFNVLKTGGHFVCKFYQGAEDKALEKQLKELFQTVHREKPESSRSESKEAYFIGLRRKHKASRDAVLGDQ